MTSYLVATTKPWNLAMYQAFVSSSSETWHLVEAPADLTLDILGKINPRYVFFPHWSWKVPPEIYERFECILFHMTDLPFGRGGSPLQNLIVSGQETTRVSAVRITGELDAGPIYLKRPLSLEGKAQDIYERVAQLVFDMIAEIVVTEPLPMPQQGAPTIFKRRTPAQSKLPDVTSAKALYDHIRMLDAESYPRAFLDLGGWRLEFSDAELSDNGVDARVSIRPCSRSES